MAMPFVARQTKASSFSGLRSHKDSTQQSLALPPVSVSKCQLWPRGSVLDQM